MRHRLLDWEEISWPQLDLLSNDYFWFDPKRVITHDYGPCRSSLSAVNLLTESLVRHRCSPPHIQHSPGCRSCGPWNGKRPFINFKTKWHWVNVVSTGSFWLHRHSRDILTLKWALKQVVWSCFLTSKLIYFDFKSNDSSSKAQQESHQIFHGGNRLRSRLVTLLLNPIPWHSQDQVIVKSTWLFIKFGSNLVDGLLAKRDLGQSRRCVPPILLLMGGFPFYFDSLLLVISVWFTPRAEHLGLRWTGCRTGTGTGCTCKQ